MELEQRRLAALLLLPYFDRENRTRLMAQRTSCGRCVQALRFFHHPTRGNHRRQHDRCADAAAAITIQKPCQVALLGLACVSAIHEPRSRKTKSSDNSYDEAVHVRRNYQITGMTFEREDRHRRLEMEEIGHPWLRAARTREPFRAAWHPRR